MIKIDNWQAKVINGLTVGAIILMVSVVVAGCSALEIGCAVTTEETRAEIRSKQKVQTDVCGDLR